MTRTYDPYSGRMWQIDGANQFASGYTGMGNNAVNGTDPDGQWVHIVAGAVIGGFINLGMKVYQGKIHNWKDGAMAFTIGAVAGGVTAATGGAMGVYAATGSFAGAFSSTAVAAASTGVMGGAITGMAGSAVGSPILGLGNQAYFHDPYSTKQYGTDILMGGLTGGAAGGISAWAQGKPIWTGGNNYFRPQMPSINGSGGHVEIGEVTGQFPDIEMPNGGTQQGSKFTMDRVDLPAFSGENISGYYVYGNKGLMSNGIYQRNIQGLAALDDNANIMNLVKKFESEALKNGANAIEINGLKIVEPKLMNSAISTRLGYSYQQISPNTIRLFKILNR